MKLNFENNFETNVTTDAAAGATTTYLDDIPSVSTPFYLTYDPLNANGHYEELLITSKTATSVSHAATTYAHSASETVRMATPASALNLLSEQSSTGWLEAGDGETWTYASSDDPTYTLTITGDKTGKYQKGDKLKLTNDGSTKYFYVTDVSYSSPNTTLTLTGGNDYSLANAAITNPYYSKVENPQGFPACFAISSKAWLTVNGGMATIQGWNFILGDGTNAKIKEITHGFTFSELPKSAVAASLGTKDDSDPTAIDDFSTSNTARFATVTKISTTIIGVGIRDVDSTIANTRRVGFTYIIKGKI